METNRSESIKKEFRIIGNEGKQKKFWKLVADKCLTADDLNIIFQCAAPTTSGANSEIWRIKSVTPKIVNEIQLNKGAATEESPILAVKQYWTLDGNYLGEVID